MNTSFKEYCRRRLDETYQMSNPFMRAMAQMVQDGAKKHPFFQAIAADRQKFTDWLNLAIDLVGEMPPEEHKRIASEPRGIAILLNPMMQRMIQAHPELGQLMNAPAYDSPSSSDPSQASVQTQKPMQTQRRTF